MFFCWLSVRKHSSSLCSAAQPRAAHSHRAHYIPNIAIIQSISVYPFGFGKSERKSEEEQKYKTVTKHSI